MRKIYSVLLIALFPFTVSSQNFEHTYGSIYEDEARHIISAYDGGFLMAGFTLNSATGPGTSYDIQLVKTDAFGSVLWTKTIGSARDEMAFWIEPSHDSTYLICGNMFDNNLSEYDDFVIRVDLSGNIISQKIYNVSHMERSYCVRQTNDNGFIVAGETLEGGVDLQLHLFKTDTAGNVLWSRSFGDSEQQTASYVQQTADNGYIACGISRQGFTWSSIFIVKTDSIGDLEWSYKYNTQPFLSKCDVSRVLETADGGYIVSGATNANQPLKSVVLMKIDSAGAIVWQNLYSTGQGERNTDIIRDGNGYVICGSTATTSGYDDLLLMKTDTNGALLWKVAFGVQDSNSIGYSLVKTYDDKFMIAGMTDAYGAGITDFFLIKTDSVGYGLCNTITPEILPDTVTLVAIANFASTTETTLVSNGSFTSISGIQDSIICNQPTGINIHENLPSFTIAPNPFSESISITVTTAEKTDNASVVIYDSFGRQIKTLRNNISARTHQFSFSATENNTRLSNGIYYCVFSAGQYRASQKVVLAH